MELMNKELPKATVVSVAHRAELEAFHSRKIVLERRKGGAKLVSDIDLIPRKGKRRLLGRFLRHRKTGVEEGGMTRSTLFPWWDGGQKAALEPPAKSAMYAPLPQSSPARTF